MATSKIVVAMSLLYHGNIFSKIVVAMSLLYHYSYDSGINDFAVTFVNK